MDKPKYLYHSSPNTAIVEFEPQNEFPRYEGEVNLVFATPHLAVAAMFLIPRHIPTEISVYGDTYVAFINSNEADYSLSDNGGAIYSLPVDTFETDAVDGMGEIEWVSNVPVKPLFKEVFKTSIEAMNKYNVVRYFVSEATLKKIQENTANGLRLVKDF
jgi:hypothetical protein